MKSLSGTRPNCDVLNFTKSMGIALLPKTVREYYEVHEWRHATAVLYQEFNDIVRS
jgi:hypothetical protein